MGKLNALSDRAAELGLRSALGEGETILKDDILNRPGSGELYGNHRASAPGEPPAPDTNTLRANTNADPTLRRDGTDLVGRIVQNTEYALALHTGTERMAARPSLTLLKSERGQQLQNAFVKGARTA